MRIGRMSWRIAGALAVTASIAGCSGDDDAVQTVRPCEQLRDHLVDLRVEGVRGKPDEVAQHRAAMRQALGDNFVASCERQMAATEIDCASKAADFAAVTACSHTAPASAQP